MACFLLHDRGGATGGDQAMRSLWRELALQWLGGEGSEILTGASALLDVLGIGSRAPSLRAFDVEREPGVSHQAMMSPGGQNRPGLKAKIPV
jgi:hypothetical protein